MREAIAEARRGIGCTSPNPPVGAVVVAGGTVLGRGWHRRAGAPHAEREALADAARNFPQRPLREATVYVTLEPCSTTGRTPPCTDALIEAGCRRVVFGAGDPNPRHSGRAAQLLAAAGIDVRAGVLCAECEELIRGFTSVQQIGRPWVLAKLAISLDGRLTRPPGEGSWLTGTAARDEVQRLRAAADAVLTSGETLRRDDPALTVRVPGLLAGRDQPLRVVVTRDPAGLPPGARLFTDAHRGRTLVRTGPDLAEVLCELASGFGCCNVMVEAGGRLVGHLLEEGLVDELAVFMAPLVTGGATPATGGVAGVPCPLTGVSFHRFGGDVMLRGVLQRPNIWVQRPS